MQILQKDSSDLYCNVTLTTIYLRFDVKVADTQQLPSKIPIASFFCSTEKKQHNQQQQQNKM